jgi:sortase B
MKKYKKQICMIAAAALLGAAVFCIFRIYNHDAQIEIAEMVEKAPEEPPDTG